ncbi:MAG: leucyl/phenylalanyl-tRNA--protein transferase [Bacteroidetes bacterium]|nr:leucyl/phenylalanyl-tRNA--protein transferase [Bacteroidota bacterium]
MPIWRLDETLWFPSVHEAEDDGLLALGGDLSPERLVLAYRSGIFPWYNADDPILWWSPDPRFVLFPDELYISKSMKQVLRNNVFEFRQNTCFEGVMRSCASQPRKGQPGTWITEEMIAAYVRLHQLGIAHSAESWQDGLLVGGLYGIRMGQVFFGESMFSTVSNASKAAFIQLVQQLQHEGIQLIDCQMHTDHLASLGARAISRAAYLQLLTQYITGRS